MKEYEVAKGNGRSVWVERPSETEPRYAVRIAYPDTNMFYTSEYFKSFKESLARAREYAHENKLTSVESLNGFDAVCDVERYLLRKDFLTEEEAEVASVVGQLHGEIFSDWEHAAETAAYKSKYGCAHCAPNNAPNLDEAQHLSMERWRSCCNLLEQYGFRRLPEAIKELEVAWILDKFVLDHEFHAEDALELLRKHLPPNGAKTRHNSIEGK